MYIMKSHVTLLLLFSYVMARCDVTYGIPYVVLKSKAPKCFQIELLSTTSKKALLRYHAPDLLRDPPEERGNNNPTKRKTMEQDGLDTMYNDRQSKRFEAMGKVMSSKDINISVSSRSESKDGAILKQWLNTNNDDDDTAPRLNIRYQLEEKEGSFEITMENDHEYFEVCVQSYKASVETPSRVSITVEPKKSEEELAIERVRQAIKNHENVSKEQRKIIEADKLVHRHTSQITADLIRMKKRSELIADGIMYSKETEQQFFDMSMNLHSAVIYYPMARVAIIIMAGCMQVSYVVQYMKSKRIY